MDKNISITVPMDYHALTRVSRMFRGLAEDLMPAVITGGEVKVGDFLSDEEVIAQLKEDAGNNIPAPEAVFAQAQVEETPEDILDPVAELAVAPIANNVELDSEGLPWDNRIHSGAKTFLAKGGGWKKKRGIDPALVDTVESELRLVMASPGTALTEPTAETVPPAPTQTEVTTEATPPPAPATAGKIATFPELMTAITASGLDQAIVKGACEAVGVTAFPLLAARPDLIPAVAERLGL